MPGPAPSRALLRARRLRGARVAPVLSAPPGRRGDLLAAYCPHPVSLELTRIGEEGGLHPRSPRARPSGGVSSIDELRID
jgi:hypothetical protein